MDTCLQDWVEFDKGFVLKSDRILTPWQKIQKEFEEGESRRLNIMRGSTPRGGYDPEFFRRQALAEPYIYPLVGWGYQVETHPKIGTSFSSITGGEYGFYASSSSSYSAPLSDGEVASKDGVEEEG